MFRVHGMQHTTSGERRISAKINQIFANFAENQPDSTEHMPKFIGMLSNSCNSFNFLKPSSKIEENNKIRR
ncbi:unnamed protein product [Caenorhabditis angaria]|uniref:Uncharacterized protein n=1 Tax=Caenorhabditis angaria TaxID=860376 RepID=A0A9P1I9A8_9PELO|nr:unnamed protein product [Caenorhabditis angaria]